MMNDVISRQAAIEAMLELQKEDDDAYGCHIPEAFHGERAAEALKSLPSAEPEEVIPHRNYKYLSDYWCACGWHLGKKWDVKYCADCGRKVNWDG